MLQNNWVQTSVEWQPKGFVNFAGYIFLEIICV